MKWTKLCHDSFYVNSEDFSGVTINKLDSYDEGLWYHYKKFNKRWKLTILDQHGNVVNTPGENHPVADGITPITGESVLFTYYEDNSYKYIIRDFDNNNTTDYLSFYIDSNQYYIDNYIAVTNKGFVVVFSNESVYQIYFINLDGQIIDTLTTSSYNYNWYGEYLIMHYETDGVYHLLVYNGELRDIETDVYLNISYNYDYYLDGGFVLYSNDNKFYLLKDGSAELILLKEEIDTYHSEFTYTYSNLITLVEFDHSSDQMRRVQIFNNDGENILDYDLTSISDSFYSGINDFLYLNESNSWVMIANDNNSNRFIIYYSSESNSISYQIISDSYYINIYGYNVRRYDDYSTIREESILICLSQIYDTTVVDMDYYYYILYLPIFKGDTEIRDFYTFADDVSKGITNKVMCYLNNIQVFVDNGDSGNYEILTFNKETEITITATEVPLGYIVGSNWWRLLNRMLFFVYSEPTVVYFLSPEGILTYTEIDITNNWSTTYERDTFVFNDWEFQKTWYSNSETGNMLVLLPDFYLNYQSSNGYESEDNLQLGTIAMYNYETMIAQIISDSKTGQTFNIDILSGDVNNWWFEIGKDYICLNYQIEQPTIPYTHTQLDYSGPVDPMNYIMDGTVQNGSDYFNTDSSYFTNMYPSLFVMCASDISISSFKIFGNLGADGSGSVDSYQYTITETYSTDYTIFVKRVWDAGDPSINHIIIVDSTDSNLEHQIISHTNHDDDYILGLSGNTSKIHFLVTAKENGILLTNEEVSNIVTNYLNIVDNKSINDILTDLNSNYANVLSGVDNIYYFSDEGNNYIEDGGNDMYDDGNYIAASFASDTGYINKIAYIDLDGNTVDSIGANSYDSFGEAVGNRYWGYSDNGGFIFDEQSITDYTLPNIDNDYINDWYWYD